MFQFICHYTRLCAVKILLRCYVYIQYSTIHGRSLAFQQAVVWLWWQWWWSFHLFDV